MIDFPTQNSALPVRSLPSVPRLSVKIVVCRVLVLFIINELNINFKKASIPKKKKTKEGRRNTLNGYLVSNMSKVNVIV